MKLPLITAAPIALISLFASALLLAGPSTAQTLPTRPAIDPACTAVTAAGSPGYYPDRPRRSNMSVLQLEELLRKYPNGVCAADVRAMLAYRQALFAAHAAISGPGASDAKLTNTRPLLFDGDYTERENRDGAEAVVVVTLAIAQDGVVESCAISSSTGSQSLISKTCPLLLGRVTANPARDVNGRPVASTMTRTVRWTPPE